MNNKILHYIFTLVLCVGSMQTYAATNSSLWGTLDTPVAPIQQIEHEQKQAEAAEQAIAMQKTVCELLSAQPSLSGDTANAQKIRDVLTQAYKAALPEYKPFLVSAEAANELYSKYRDLYLKTYCVSGTKR